MYFRALVDHLNSSHEMEYELTCMHACVHANWIVGEGKYLERRFIGLSFPSLHHLIHFVKELLHCVDCCSRAAMALMWGFFIHPKPCIAQALNTCCPSQQIIQFPIHARNKFNVLTQQGKRGGGFHSNQDKK